LATSEGAASYPGVYFDGRSAGGHDVQVGFDGEDLIIAASGQILAHWPLKKLLRLADSAESAIRLGCLGHEGALEVGDPDFRKALKAAAPHLFTGLGFWGTLRLAFILALVSAALLAGFYFGLPRAAEALVPLIPRETEARIGAGYYARIKSDADTCKADDAAKAALDHLVSRLLGKNLPFTPTVDIIDMHMENAFALPGGHVLVTKSLIAAMTGPDELAGVLAHEFGHVIERHPMIAVVENYGLNTVLTIMTGGSAGSSETVIGITGSLAQLSYSRRLEARADEHALILLDDAKISPKGFADLFDRLEAEQKKAIGFGIPAILNSHPPSPERAARARAADKPGTSPALTETDWAAIKAACNPPKEEDKSAKPKNENKKKRK
jgi:predicted Zn-dependent protease